MAPGIILLLLVRRECRSRPLIVVRDRLDSRRGGSVMSACGGSIATAGMKWPGGLVRLGGLGEVAEARDPYALALGLASARMAGLLVDREADEKRRERKRRVLQEKIKLLRDAFPEYGDRLRDRASLENLLCEQNLDPEQARILLVDLSFADAFAPYELRTDVKDVKAALETVAGDVGVEKSFVAEISKTRRDAARAHRLQLTGRHVAIGLVGAGLFAAGGWMFAPVLAAALGAVAGLSGAAATSFGLALLGGGSLAAGGAGMAGGMAVVAGTSAAVGGAAFSGASVMHSLGAAGAREELVKLQTTYKAVLLHSQQDQAKARKVVKQLAQQQATLEEDLARERTLNDDNAQRVKNLEKTIEHIERSLEWMKEQAA
jgi:hypothetical protein